jgi:hypothetical protein
MDKLKAGNGREELYSCKVNYRVHNLQKENQVVSYIGVVLLLGEQLFNLGCNSKLLQHMKGYEGSLSSCLRISDASSNYM